MALGVYPEITLLEARDRRIQARKALAIGNDPAELKRASKRQIILDQANTFEAIGREWFDRRKHAWVPSYCQKVLTRLEQYVFPKIGSRRIAEIGAPEVLEVLRGAESKGALDTAHRLKQTCGQIFMYAIATGRAQRNPVPDLHGALKPQVVKHRAYLNESELPQFLKLLKKFDGHTLTALALRFLILTFVRTTELRAAQWPEINFDKAEWRIPPERMKMRTTHIVPLSRQAMDVLLQIQRHSGNHPYIFPNGKNMMTYMSENTMLFALYRMGYHLRATGHGFRSTASTILNESGFPPDVIERQLAHSERDGVRAAYNHAQYLPQRREMMQWYADHLEKLNGEPFALN